MITSFAGPRTFHLKNKERFEFTVNGVKVALQRADAGPHERLEFVAEVDGYSALRRGHEAILGFYVPESLR